MNSLIIVADLGRFKVFRVVRDPEDPSPSIDLISDEDFANDYSRFVNRDTDQAGQFPSGPSGMAAGERHGEVEEARKAQLGRVAAAIDLAARGEPGLKIYLAAPQPINRRLLEHLSPDVRERVHKDLALDLIKEPKLELLRRFEIT